MVTISSRSFTPSPTHPNRLVLMGPGPCAHAHFTSSLWLWAVCVSLPRLPASFLPGALTTSRAIPLLCLEPAPFSYPLCRRSKQHVVKVNQVSVQFTSTDIQINPLCEDQLDRNKPFVLDSQLLLPIHLCVGFKFVRSLWPLSLSQRCVLSLIARFLTKSDTHHRTHSFSSVSHKCTHAYSRSHTHAHTHTEEMQRLMSVMGEAPDPSKVCWSVLQCVAVCCSVLQRVAMCCSALQCCSSMGEDRPNLLRHFVLRCYNVLL